VRIRSFLFALVFSSLVVVSILVGCSSKNEQGSTARKPVVKAELPITEVVQTVNFNFDDTWLSVMSVVNSRNIEITLLNKELGRLTSAWIPMKDSICGVYDSNAAPLSCRTQYSFYIQRISETISSVTVRYVEKCLDREEMDLICAGSNAERNMIAIIDDLKVLLHIAPHSHEKA